MYLSYEKSDFFKDFCFFPPNFWKHQTNETKNSGYFCFSIRFGQKSLCRWRLVEIRMPLSQRFCSFQPIYITINAPKMTTATNYKAIQYHLREPWS